MLRAGILARDGSSVLLTPKPEHQACSGGVFRLCVVPALSLFFLLLFPLRNASSAEPVKGPFTIVCVNTDAPFAYRDDQDNIVGIIPDLWQRWSQQAQVKIRFTDSSEVKPLVPETAIGRTVLCGIFSSVDETAGYVWSRSLLDIPYSLYSSPDTHLMDSPEKSAGVALGLVQNESLEEYLRTRFPSARVLIYPSTFDLVNAATSGGLQVFVLPKQTGLFYMSRMPALRSFQGSILPLAPLQLKIGVQYSDRDLLPQIQQGMHAISDLDLHEMLANHAGFIRIDKAFIPLWVKYLLLGFGGLFAILLPYCWLRSRAKMRTVVREMAKQTQELQLSYRALQNSEEWLRTTLDSIGDGVIVTDEKEVVLRLNQVAEALTGWSTEKACRQPLLTVFPIQLAEDGAASPRLTDVLADDRKRHEFLLKADGHKCSRISASVSRIKKPDGDLGGFVVVFRDVTPEYEKQHLVEKHEKQLLLAIEGTNAGVWDWNVRTGQIIVNDRWAAMLGYTVNELEPVTCDVKTALCHPDDWKRSLREQQRHFSGDIEIYECELRIRHKSGHWVWVLDRGRIAERNPDGSPLRVVGTHTDITRRKDAEAALNKRLVALTMPLDSPEDISLGTLFNLEEIQALQDLVSSATGVASIITTPDGTPITRASNFCRLCRDIIRKTPTGCANCMRSDATLGRVNPDGPTVCPCLSGGLWDAGVSITVGERHIANWLIGQVRDETQSEEDMVAYAREIGADEQELLKAFREVPSMSSDRFRKVGEMVFQIARHLSDVAYQNVQQARFITARQRAEDDLRASEENLTATLNSIGDAVIATDTKGRITRMNPVAEVLTGWPAEEAVGEQLEEVFHIVNADTRKKVDSPFHKVMASGGVVGLANHTVLVSRSGDEYQISDSGAPIRDKDGMITGVVLVFRDITNEHQLQEQLLHSRKMEAIGQLAGGVAHDFNNMLGGIIGSAELLQRQLPSGSSTQSSVDLILKAAKRAAELTEKLVSFAQKGKALSTPFDVHVPLRDAVALLERTIDKRVRITVQPDALQATVIGDALQLQNTFLNLGLNAAQAIPEGGALLFRTRSVEVSGAECADSPFDLEAGEYVEIEVTDTGIGIPETHMERIFEPFFTTKPGGKNTGLGLPAVYGAIQQHRGDIRVQSVVGKGTTFLLRLPLADESEGEVIELSPAVMASGCIMLVDDEEIIRATGSAALQSLGYTVLAPLSTDEALEVFRLRHETIDLVILDLMMPGLHGKECFEKFKEMNPACRIILTSGFSVERDVREFRDRGLCGFLHKPFRCADLAQAVAAALKSPSR